MLTGPKSLLPWLADGALDIVQPDLTKVGELREQRRIAWLTREFGVRNVGHGGNTAIGLAAACCLPPPCPTRRSSTTSPAKLMLSASSPNPGL